MAVRRSVAVVVVLAAPFVGVAYGASALVAPVARATASALVALVTPLNPPVPSPVAEVAPEVAAAPAEALPVAGSGKGAPRRAVSRPAPAKPQALFVSQQTVLKLAESAARPSGAFVPQTAEHPAGLRLANVAGLGIGVQDGDILVEALGIAPRAPGEIIGAIIQARANQVRFLSGTLWRRGDTFRITVEQPYLPAKG